MLKTHAVLGLEDFEQIRATLNEYAGLWFSPDMRPVVERRLRDRLVALSLGSFAEYRRQLLEDVAELETAVELCTVNETYAFRNANQLRAFRDHVLPRLRSRERIVIWSAGCASGEEAYSVGAIVLGSGLFSPERVRIFGTDISRRCIAAARKGVYSASSFREAQFSSYKQYFTLNPDGSRAVSSELRSVCSFRQANLLEQSIGGFIDVIFCRNVLIHLDDAARRRIVLGFHERLSPGGYLFLGHSESLLRDTQPFTVEQLGHNAARDPFPSRKLDGGRDDAGPMSEIVYRKQDIPGGSR